jgi:C1A family cysteine protease
MNTQRKFGWLPDLPDTRDVAFSISRPADFTRIHDLRWEDTIAAIRDQLNGGSCTGFGVSGIAWSAMLSDKTFKVPAFHPSELFPYYNGRANKKQDTGASIREVVKSTVHYGLAPLETWPYVVANITIKPPARAYELALKFKTIKYARVAQTESQIINTLASGYPVVFGHLCHSNFWNVKHDGMVPMPSGRIEGGHCEYIMGYNMDKKLFTVQNSWGTKRGDRGYEYFPFDYILNPDFCMDFWVIYEVSI